MSEFRNFHTAHRRRDLLALLLASTDYSCNDSLLRMALRERGYLVSAASLREDLDVMATAGLIRMREIGEMVIATLLQRGRDVAEGAEVIDGVARPDPGSQ